MRACNVSTNSESKYKKGGQFYVAVILCWVVTGMLVTDSIFIFLAFILVEYFVCYVFIRGTFDDWKRDIRFKWKRGTFLEAQTIEKEYEFFAHDIPTISPHLSEEN